MTAAEPRSGAGAPAAGIDAREALLVGLAILFVVILGSQVVVEATRSGRLAGLVPWDDCMILYNALHWFRGLGAAGSLSGAVEWVQENGPHSPMADLTALIGLGLGKTVFAPYFLNSWTAAVAVAALLYATRGVRHTTRVALVALLLAQPLLLATFVNLKADSKGGILLAVAIFVLHEARSRRARGLFVLGSVLLGAAISAKLTAFYLPVLALGILAVMSGIQIRRRTAEIEQRLPNLSLAAIMSGAAVVPFAAFFLWGAQGDLLRYIGQALSDVWRDGLSPMTRASLYLPGGTEPWGVLHLLLFGMNGFLLWAAIVEGKREVLRPLAATWLIAAAVFAPLILAQTSEAGFGSFFLGALVGNLLVAARLTGSFGRSGSWAVLGFAAIALPFAEAPSGPIPLHARREAAAVIQRVADDIIEITESPSPVVRVMFEDGVAGFPNIGLLHYTRTGRVINVDRVDDLEPRDEVLSFVRQGDFVLTLRPDPSASSVGYTLARRFETTRNLAETDATIASMNFGVAREYGWPGGVMTLYARTGD